MPKTEDEINAEKAKKPRPDLIPARAVMAAGRALAYGAHKHGVVDGRGTYRIAGTEQAKIETHLASCLRHLLEFQIDPNAVEEGSGLSVLDHAFAQLAIVVDLAEDPPTLLAADPGAPNEPKPKPKLYDRVRVTKACEELSTSSLGQVGATGTLVYIASPTYSDAYYLLEDDSERRWAAAVEVVDRWMLPEGWAWGRSSGHWRAEGHQLSVGPSLDDAAAQALAPDVHDLVMKRQQEDPPR